MKIMENKDDLFDKSISPWTLAFNDPGYEEGFQKIMKHNKHLNPLYKFLAYALNATVIIFRILALLSSYRAVTVPRNPLNKNVELASVISIGICAMIEVVLRLTDHARYVQGFFFLTALKITNVASCFYSDKGPFFSPIQAFGFMIDFPCNLVLFRSWRATAVSATIF